MISAKNLPLWLFGLFLISVIVHNAVYGLLNFEEPFFFILALLALLAFVISGVYSMILILVDFFKPKKKKSRRDSDQK